MNDAAHEVDRLFARFARSGDPDALGEVYDRLAPELLRVALHAMPDAASAEDVLQATFVAAIERVEHFDPGRRVLPWLLGILAHEARKARARARRSPEVARLVPVPSVDPTEEAERRELLRELDAALERVPAAFRPVLRLRLAHGLSVPEIASALERPPGTVRSQLARGIALLRRALPASLAGALASCASPVRGLDQVRAGLLQHAARVRAPVSPLTTTLAGALAVKTLVAASLVLISVLCAWLARRPESRGAAASEPRSAQRDQILPAERAPARDEREVGGREPQSSAPATPRTARGEPTPLAAALRVRALRPGGAPAAGEIVLVTSVRAHADEVVTRTTDAQGQASFDDLGPGHFGVRLLRGGEASVALDGEHDQELVLELMRGVTVEGRVVDPQGEPAAGAEVWLSERFRGNRGFVVTRSDARGEFRLTNVGPDQHLGARMAGHAPGPLRSVRAAPGDVVPLELRLGGEGAELNGSVVDRDGAPVPGAWILAGVEQPGSVRVEDGSFVPGPPPQSARADAHGSFALTGLLPGTSPIQVRAPGFAPSIQVQELLPGPNPAVQLVLVPEARLAGTVHTASGAPLASAWVHAGPTEAFVSAGTWSGTDGRYELVGLAPGSVRVRAEHRRAGAVELDLAPRAGQTLAWDPVLRPTPRIEGRIVDAHGAPCPEQVVVVLAGGDRERRSTSTRSDAEGRFEIGDLEACAYLLWVQPPLGWREFPLLEREEVWPDGPPLVLELPDVRAYGDIVLEVTDAGGVPVPGVELQVWHEERRLWRTFASEGEHGRIAVAHVPPGTVTLELRHPDHPWKSLGRHAIELGATLDLGRVALDPAGRLHARLEGPAAERTDLHAMVVGPDGHESGVARIEAGVLRVAPLVAGEHQLWLSGDGLTQVRLPFHIEPGVETSLALRLEPCAVREVVFTPPADAHPSWIALSLLRPDGSLAWGGNADCSLDPPRARVSAPAGTYRLWAGAEGDLGGELELALPGAGSPTLVLRPKP